ncbi:lytic transglycosylase domain-containing protein [Pararhodobacter sp. SW119]|uniref:lytic transglycosylase domain-containing protein n=1 Tax=Pararhodobacter sp. SW119 TaxID=2780075 RepID=UPI001FD858E3|nr:lytic transglycosylase domain-containing protein [Pararhodobacter sp. SW119]
MRTTIAIVVLSLGIVPLAGPGVANGLRLGGNAGAEVVARQQTRLMETRLARQYSASERHLPNLPQPVDARAPRYTGPNAGPFLDMARTAARRHNIPEDMFLRLVHQESRWNAGAISPKGARGLAQLMPDTARLLRVDPDDPRQNLDGGARYLRMMYDRFGNWRLALAAYNAGPEAVQRHGGVPPYAETTQYVRIILGSG